MSERLHTYYNEELEALRSLGAEFARAYPTIAARLELDDQQCADPHVERMLEAVALLTARIRQKLDDTFPEITEALLQVLYPELLRPVPAAAIVQLRPGGDAGALAEGPEIPAGTGLVARPVGGVRCRFRTTYPVRLWPIRVESAQMEPDRVTIPGKPAGSIALLRLRLRPLDGAPGLNQLAGAMDRLRFYLDGNRAAVSDLYELLLNDAVAVWAQPIRTDDSGTSQDAPIRLEPESIQAVGFEPEDGLLPDRLTSFPGHRLIQDYFTLPEKFLFVDLCGLERLADHPFEADQSVELQIFLRRSPGDAVRIDAKSFRLGCTPAVNLFPRTAEPIRLDQTRTDYPLIADVNRPLAAEIFAIERVAGISERTGESTAYQPFYTPRRLEARGEPPGAFWYARRTHSTRKGDPGHGMSLAVVDRDFDPVSRPDQVLHVQLTCTNRDVPLELSPGGPLAELDIDSPAPVGGVTLITKPTETHRPPLGRRTQWPLIALLSLNHLSLTDPDRGLQALKAILSTYDFTGSNTTRQKIDGLVDLQSRRVAGRIASPDGLAVCLGIEVDLTFDEENYVGSGIFLMASVLERFLSMYAAINTFTQLRVRSRQREGVVKRWRPRTGHRILL